jgi:hypothetical protein
MQLLLLKNIGIHTGWYAYVHASHANCNVCAKIILILAIIDKVSAIVIKVCLKLGILSLESRG